MTRTIISSAAKEIIIGFDAPFCVIGERINPTGRKLLAEEMANGDYSRVKSDAVAQIDAGANMLDVNAGIPLADEPKILANAIKLIRESRTEIRKVVWPTRIETTQTFLVVFISIIVLCLIFWGLESLLTFLTKLVLG